MPKREAPGCVQVLDDGHLVIPDRPGNKRFDGIRNLLENPGIGLLFLLPRSEETLRVNGRALIVRDPDVLARFAVGGKLPALALAVEAQESFLHCAKCVKRSGLWDESKWPDLGGLASPAQMFLDHAKPRDMTVEALDRRLRDGARTNPYGARRGDVSMIDHDRSISRRSLLAGGAALAAATWAPRRAAAQGAAIRLGTLTPLTGAGGSHGPSHRHAEAV